MGLRKVASAVERVAFDASACLEACGGRYVEHAAVRGTQHWPQKSARESHDGADVELDHRALALGIELTERAGAAEPRIVDEM